MVAAHLKADQESLSVRRAWIEIHREELVEQPRKSLSVRSAWIEIILSLT